MKLSEGVEWGIHCALLLTGCSRDEAISGKTLASAYGLSESYLLKHLKVMVAAGLLKSISGPYGGYRLNKDPEQITLLNIYEAFEGNDSIFRCQEIRQCGDLGLKNKSFYKRDCGVKKAMMKAEAAYKQSLSQVSLQDIAEEFIDSADQRLLHHIESWSEKSRRSSAKK